MQGVGQPVRSRPGLPLLPLRVEPQLYRIAGYSQLPMLAQALEVYASRLDEATAHELDHSRNRASPSSATFWTPPNSMELQRISEKVDHHASTDGGWCALARGVFQRHPKQGSHGPDRNLAHPHGGHGRLGLREVRRAAWRRMPTGVLATGVLE